MNSILISTECVVDLPQELYQNKDVSIIYYDIKTEGGLFRDTVEINSDNVLEYMMGGKKKANSVVPTANEFKNFFQKGLAEYDRIIHICISSGISVAYSNALLARAKMGQDGNKVYIIDSRHLSSGQGLVALEAMKYRDQGMNCKEIVEQVEKVIPRISTSFLSNNADYLYYNGKVKKSMMDICNLFHIHPVLAMIDGKLTLKKVYLGNYDKVARRYIKNCIGNAEMLDKRYCFITYVGCDKENLDKVEERVRNHAGFEAIYRQQASATVSCNCGPKTFGIISLRKE